MGQAETSTPDPLGEDFCGFGTYLICLPFLWQNGVMTDLNTLIPAGSPLFLLVAVDINSRGEFVGFAFQTSTLEVHAYLATPSNNGVGSESATPTARGETSESPKVALPENVRKLLRQRLGFGRFGGGLIRTQ